jgi:hypothetical protein
MSVTTNVIALISIDTIASLPPEGGEGAPVEQGSPNRLEKIDQACGPVGADRLNQRECGPIGPSLDVGSEGFAHLGERFVLLYEAASD